MSFELTEARRLFFRYFQPLSIPIAPEDAAVLDTATRLDVPFDDRPVAVYSWGEGPTMLLVHGGLGYGGQFSPFVKPLVDAGYRVVAFDAPGHGRSRHRFLTADMAARVIHAIAKDVAPVHAVVTHSLGCLWGLHAKRHGLACNAMVCLAPFADVRMIFEMFCAMNQASPESKAQLERLVEAFEGPNVFERFSPMNIVGQLDVRALVLHGADDNFIPSDAGKRVAEAWPNCKFEPVAGMSHNTILAHAPTIQRVIEFCRES